jgi:hypothetical protein
MSVLSGGLRRLTQHFTLNEVKWSDGEETTTDVQCGCVTGLFGRDSSRCDQSLKPADFLQEGDAFAGINLELV